MIKETINGAQCFALDLADQKKAQNEFFRRMAHIPEEWDAKRVYAGVAAEVFKDTFPEITAAIEALRDEKDPEKKRPVFVKGFRVGRIAHNLSKHSTPTAELIAEKFLRKERGRSHTSEPEIVLAMATARLLGHRNIVPGEVYQNSSFGKRDDRHDHPGYAVVIGEHGVDGVQTKIWYPGTNSEAEPDFSAEVKRGSLLIIPPEFKHEVEGFEGIRKKTNGGQRNTAAIITIDNTDKKITAKELQAGREQYLLPSSSIGKFK